MPTIFNASQLISVGTSEVTRTTLADRAMLGTDALKVERVTLAAGAHTPPASVTAAEHFLYVIRGAGQAHVGAQTFPLEPESMLWLESGDTYFLDAGPGQLEILLCSAPDAE